MTRSVAWQAQLHLPGNAVSSKRMKFYEELAHWWPLFSPPSQYVEEAEDLMARLGPIPSNRRPTLLELGCGGGSLASHFAARFDLTLTDISPAMLSVCRETIPRADCAEGDMRTLRLRRRFDAVLVHDAVMYATTPDDVVATLQTAAAHVAPDGVVAVVPDFVRETFAPDSEFGGEDANDGRGFRYLAWVSDPDPSDDTYVVDYAFMMMSVGGAVRVEHDRHVEGLFARERWLDWFRESGLAASSDLDPWGRHVFIARPL